MRRPTDWSRRSSATPLPRSGRPDTSTSAATPASLASIQPASFTTRVRPRCVCRGSPSVTSPGRWWRCARPSCCRPMSPASSSTSSACMAPIPPITAIATGSWAPIRTGSRPEPSAGRAIRDCRRALIASRPWSPMPMACGRPCALACLRGVGAVVAAALGSSRLSHAGRARGPGLSRRATAPPTAARAAGRDAHPRAGRRASHQQPPRARARRGAGDPHPALCQPLPRVPHAADADRRGPAQGPGTGGRRRFGRARATLPGSTAAPGRPTAGPGPPPVGYGGSLQG
jgi:hypothetical protein